ncbi:hypothetical protein BBL88_06340 [Vibrio parahaemolyticus]|uniref:hypothetical protein n=1 Tax=Vibrio parahaemolyticus TaxID=670 RepID=UPI00084AB5BE|nr:hypothetical protein [Vibrio parahaemolyticus]ODW58655.1 hypothetical protein BBL88_06340 [Vibrio parahaemolyticus]
MTNNSIPTTYIPLEQFHIVPLTGLSPAELKTSAKRTSHDREKISHTTKLNAITKRLGIAGGFSAYEKEYNGSLLPFMAKHNLRKRKDLLEHKKKGTYHLYYPFTHQQVSERLFFFAGSTPQKLFTGHDFDFSGVFGWHSSDLHYVLEQDADWQQVILNNYHVRQIADSNFDENVLPLRQQELLNLDVASEIMLSVVDRTGLPSVLDYLTSKTTVPVERPTRYKQISVKIVDLILLNNRIITSGSSYHLLGNALTNITNTAAHIKLYAENTTPIEEATIDIDSQTYIQTLLTSRFKESDAGWVNVLPYNDNLIFLSDGKGNFDFLIKNQRDKVFSHQVYGDNLKRADIPSFIEDYRFERWHYFEYEGNREWDRHCSEMSYYHNGGLMQNYPGTQAILRDYYQNKGVYHPEHRTSNVRLDGFNQVSIDDKEMMVSELITISDLIYFLEENAEYSKNRQGDSLAPVNSESDITLPASCTFFDVLAYINWLEKQTRVPLRILSYSEYKSLRGENWSKPKRGQDSDMTFISTTGEEYDSHPPYMAQNDFNNLHLRFPKPLHCVEENGLQFIDSNFFCEWLLEGVQIRSASLTSFYMDDYVLRARGPQDSTGKYKGMKTGFRVCYELKKH